MSQFEIMANVFLEVFSLPSMFGVECPHLALSVIALSKPGER